VNPSSPTGTSGTPRWRGTVQTYGAVLRGAGQALEDLRLSGLRHQDGLRRLLLGGHGRGRGRGRGSVILEPAMGRIST
jgi:hypothetical protein